MEHFIGVCIMTKNIKVFLLAFFIGGIIAYMANLVWGDLAKSQVDPQLITEAISEAIANHEADPTAHLGDGESLEQHKANEVLDHPQQSVVMDKQAYSFYDEIATVLGGYGWDPDVGTFSPTGKRDFDGSLFSQTEIYCIQELPFSFLASYPNKPLLYRFRLIMNGAQNSDGYARLTWSEGGSDDADDKVQFVKDGTSYYFRIYVGGTKVHEYTLQTGGEMDKFVAVYFNKDEAKIDLFVDSVLVSSYETADWHDLIFYNMGVHMLRTTNTSISLTITLWGAKYTLLDI